MKTTFALALLAAVALRAHGAPTLKEGAALWESAIETASAAAVPAAVAPEEKEREKKSNYYPGGASIGYGVGGLTPCAAASAGHLGGGYGGSGISFGHGASGISLGHGSLVGPGIHSGVGIGGFGPGYGVRPTLSYGDFGGQHYRESEDNEQQGTVHQASENQEQMARMVQLQMQQQDALNSASILNQAVSSEKTSERSAYGGGYGSGLAAGGGSGLALGGGVISTGLRPLGGSAVAVFPGSGLGGCGAIPLMLSCSPNLVQGYMQPLHVHGGAVGHGYGGGAFIAGGHGLYREEEAPAQMHQTRQKVGLSHQKQGTSHASSVTKTSSSSHRFQQKSSSNKNELVA